jgi:hypothetical protein
MKLLQPTVSKGDLIVEKETFSFWGTTTPKKTAFSTGDRLRILEELDLNSPIVSHVSVEKKETYPYEALFRRYAILIQLTIVSTFY